MGLLDIFESHRNEFDNTHHASVTHELLSGAVAYEAAKAYEKHCKKNGQPVNHAEAKALLAGFAGAALDGLVESKGLNAWDEHKRKQARERAVERLSESITVDYA